MPIKRVYLAGPLFTQGEWMFNVRLAEAFRSAGLEVILPQERSVPMLDGAEQFSAQALFDYNVAGIDSCDVVVAIMDQADPDSGTCWECGYAYRLGRPIVGVRTDFRHSGDDGDLPLNLMLARSFQEFIQLPIQKRNDSSWIVERIVEAIGRIDKVQ